MLLALSAHAAELDAAGRAWVGAGIDTNPRRDFVLADHCTATDRTGCTPTDAVLQGVLQLDGALRFERGALLASYDLGGRKFVLLPTEDTLVQTGLVEGELYLLPNIGLGGTLHVRDRRGADRAYTDLGAEGFVRIVAQGRLDAKLRVGYHRFLFWPRFPYSFWAPDFGFNARFRINRQHSINAFLDYEPRAYNATASADPELDPQPELGPRKDTFLSVGVGYQYRGPWAFGFSYSFLESSSNSFGETLRRHRITLNAGVKLFWKVSMLGAAVLQIVQYPDGVYLSEELIVIDDDESQNQVSLKLVRPVGDWFEVDFRWQLFFNRLVKNELSYFRQTFTVGLSFRLGTY